MPLEIVLQCLVKISELHMEERISSSRGVQVQPPSGKGTGPQLESVEMQPWRSYAGRPLAEAFQAAYEDIKTNWERYIELYKREVQGGESRSRADESEG